MALGAKHSGFPPLKFTKVILCTSCILFLAAQDDETEEIRTLVEKLALQNIEERDKAEPNLPVCLISD